MTTDSTTLAGEPDDLSLKPVMDEPRTKVSSTKSSRAGAGLTAAESSLASTAYPIEEA
jgi:hypothetical protein